MKTFGEFFEQLRRRVEKTGRTDDACRAMDAYKDRCRTEAVIYLNKEDGGWKKIADQELSYENLRMFCQEVLRPGIEKLLVIVNDEKFRPDSFAWNIDATSEFFHLTMEEARRCGLDVDDTGWLKSS